MTPVAHDKKTFLKLLTMPHTLVVVFSLVIVVLALSWLVPSGEYQRVKVETSQAYER